MQRKKITRDLGELNGKLLVFGGVYSNLQALSALKGIAEMLSIPASHVICTGDVVAYCAQPEACVQSIQDWGISCIAGNVEISLREGQDDCGCDFSEGSRCDIFSRSWYPFAQKNLSTTSIDWMHSLPDFLSFSFGERSGLVVHGSYHDTSEYIFTSTDWETKKKNFEETGADLILSGHCGLPFSQEKENKTWINPGVIGMPANDGTPRVWYMVLETSPAGKFTFQHKSFIYDNKLTSGLMESHHLPLAYSKTLQSGLWDNCEILPEEETNLKGIKINF